MRILTAIIMILAALSSAAGESQYYSWVDEDGVTNFSERPPGDQAAEAPADSAPQYTGQRPGAVEPEEPASEESASNASTTPGNSSNSNNAGGDVDPDALIADERAALQAKISETKKGNCDIGKRNLAQLEAYARIRVTEDGQERVLGEDERQERITEARRIIQENCSG